MEGALPPFSAPPFTPLACLPGPQLCGALLLDPPQAAHQAFPCLGSEQRPVQGTGLGEWGEGHQAATVLP